MAGLLFPAVLAAQGPGNAAPKSSVLGASDKPALSATKPAPGMEMGAGFRGCIAKPYEAAELGKVVHDMIESSNVNVVSLNFPTHAAG